MVEVARGNHLLPQKFSGATVILPVLTETRSLCDTVDIILRDCRDDIDRFLIIVCRTTCPESLAAASELQREHGSLVQVHAQRRLFLGGAMQDAFELVESSHAIMMASDMETDPNQVQALIAAARTDPAAIVTASRWIPGAGFYGYPRMKRLGNRLFQRVFSLLYRTKLTDLTYGYRLFPTSLMQSIAWEELRHAFLFETLVKPLRLGVSVIEIPSMWRSRVEGESQNRICNYIDYLRLGLKVRFEPRSALVKPQTEPVQVEPSGSSAGSP
jgi:glycosyl transferase family 2